MSSLRHVLALALVSAAVVLGGAPACSQQTEGERCDSAKAGDADCESGLTCIIANNLLNGRDGADRCCPDAGSETDKRCTRGTPSTGTAGSGGTSSAGSSSGGSGGSSSESEAGAAGTPVEASAGAGGAG